MKLSPSSNPLALFTLIVIMAIAFALLLVSRSSPADGTPVKEEALPAGANPHWFQRTREIGNHYGLGEMFVRQIKQESAFRDDIITGQTISWAGATGIAQIIPWMHPEVNPLDPEQSLHYAAQFMNELIARYGGDREKALAAYNAGAGTIDWVVGACGAGWRACLPPETQEYLQKIVVPEPAPTATPPAPRSRPRPASVGWLTFMRAVDRLHTDEEYTPAWNLP